MVVRKHLDRPYWARILDKKFSYFHINEPDFSGCISIIYINKITSPLIKTMLGKSFVLADVGYYWLQFLPTNQNYSLTTTYDGNHNIVQWYFDITLKNETNDTTSLPYFDDLFLDIVVIPGEEPILIDEDDLEAALSSKSITKDQYNLAYLHAHMLLRTLAIDQGKLTEISEKYSKIMLDKIGLRSE